MPNNRRIAKNTVFLYFRMLFIMGAALYASRVVLKILGNEDYGLYNVIGGVISMFTFLTGSLTGASSRYMTFELGRNNLKRLNVVFNTSLLLHVAISCVIFILAESIGLWFVKYKLVIPPERMNAALWVYQATIFASIIAMCQIPFNAMIIAYENMKVYAWGGIIEAMLHVSIALLLFVLPGDHLIVYAWLLLLVKLLVFSFYLLYVRFSFASSQPHMNRQWTLYRTMLGYIGSDLIGGLAVLAQGQGLNILLNLFFGPTVNAARGIVYQVQGAVMQFNNNFMTAVKPQIIKSYAIGQISEMMNLVIFGSCISFYLTWLIALPVFLETDFILTLWLGEYPDHCISFLHLVLVLCLIQAIKTPRTTVYHAMARLKTPNLIVGTILCAALPLAYFLLKAGYAPESVFVAANITMFLSEIASVIILRFYLKRPITSYLTKVYIRTAVIAISSFMLSSVAFRHISIHDATFVRLVFTTLTTSVITGLIIVIFDQDIRIKTQNILYGFIHR